VRKSSREGRRGSDNGGYFVQPTVLTKTNQNMKVVREEIFGPVVCEQPITDEDLETIAREANNTTYGLTASVWGRDLSKANKLAKRVRAGTVWVNWHNVFDASLPFGGYKQSGWGREMGEFVLNNYTQVKAVTTALRSLSDVPMPGSVTGRSRT
jgi:phenylacetaldehyde dehydrogenase